MQKERDFAYKSKQSYRSKSSNQDGHLSGLQEDQSAMIRQEYALHCIAAEAPPIIQSGNECVCE